MLWAVTKCVRVAPDGIRTTLTLCFEDTVPLSCALHQAKVIHYTDKIRRVGMDKVMDQRLGVDQQQRWEMSDVTRLDNLKVREAQGSVLVVP